MSVGNGSCYEVDTYFSTPEHFSRFWCHNLPQIPLLVFCESSVAQYVKWALMNWNNADHSCKSRIHSRSMNIEHLIVALVDQNWSIHCRRKTVRLFEHPRNGRILGFSRRYFVFSHQQWPMFLWFCKRKKWPNFKLRIGAKALGWNFIVTLFALISLTIAIGGIDTLAQRFWCSIRMVVYIVLRIQYINIHYTWYDIVTRFNITLGCQLLALLWTSLLMTIRC